MGCRDKCTACSKAVLHLGSLRSAIESSLPTVVITCYSQGCTERIIRLLPARKNIVLGLLFLGGISAVSCRNPIDDQLSAALRLKIGESMGN